MQWKCIWFSSVQVFSMAFGQKWSLMVNILHDNFIVRLGSMCYLLCPNWDISESCTSVWDLWSRVHVFAWEFWRYWLWKEWSLCPLLYIQNLNYRNYLETSLSPLLYIHFRITQLSGMETLGTHSNVKTALWLRTFLLPTWLYSLFFYISSFCVCFLTVLWKAVTHWLSEILETDYCFS